MSIDLRTFTYIDILMPKLAGFLQTVSQGYQPLERQSVLYVEVAPGISINQVTDICLKRTSVEPGMQIVERAFGILEVHHFDQGQIRAAGQAILDYYGITEEDRLAPVVKTNQVITGVQGHQSMLINRMRHGDLIAENDTLYVMECHPAGYAMIAANEAEKASPIQLLEMRAVGAYGRLYLSGNYEEVLEAQRAIIDTLESLKGRPNEGHSR
jgi:hypothetical protein